MNAAAVVALQHTAALSLNMVSPVRMSIICDLAGTPGREGQAQAVPRRLVRERQSELNARILNSKRQGLYSESLFGNGNVIGSNPSVVQGSILLWTAFIAFRTFSLVHLTPVVVLMSCPFSHSAIRAYGFPSS